MNIILLFTYGVSLKDWENTGILQREVSYYLHLQDKYNFRVTFLTFGNSEDENIETGDIKVIPIYKYFYKSQYKIINYFSSIFIPYFFKDRLPKNNLIIKTNQLHGSWIAIIFNFVLKGGRLIIRTGYNPQIFAKQEKKSRVKIFFYKFQNLISLKFCDLFFVTSASDKYFLENNFNKTLIKKVRKVPNWIRLREYQPFEKRLSENILSVGRLETQKNFEEMIRIFTNTNLSLDIYGEGSLRKELESLAEQNNVKVNFYGKLSNAKLIETYEKYKYYISTSNFEGNPKSTMEALQAGCIVFAKDYANNRELIEDGKNGYLFDKENQEIIKTIYEIKNKTIDPISVSKNAYKSTLKYRMEDVAKIETDLYIN